MFQSVLIRIYFQQIFLQKLTYGLIEIHNINTTLKAYYQL